MNTDQVVEMACGQCGSNKTICVERRLAYDSWYCYACRESYDVRNASPGAERLQRVDWPVRPTSTSRR
jgi:hypothetical protein